MDRIDALLDIYLESGAFPADATEAERKEVCLLYTSDAADERSSVDLGGRRIIKKKKHTRNIRRQWSTYKYVN